MKKAVSSAPRVDLIEKLSLSDLTMFCGTSPDWVITLVEHGVVTPITRAAPEWEFTSPHIARARKAARLMRDLGLNVAGVALVLDLIEERDALTRKLAFLDAQTLH
jgi:chaperone modulatory protein CbpM